MAAIYYAGADLPDLAVTWKDRSGALINFASGWTFVAKVGPEGGPASLTKSSGFTGTGSDPNLTIAWTTSELGTLPPGEYLLQITATRTADAKERIMQGTIEIRPGL